MDNQVLSVADHRRDQARLTYVYPVVSRRAAGLSVGINLNVNRACNWACVYCQVEGLSRGGPDPVDMVLLEQELAGFLGQVLAGDYLQRHVPEGYRRLADIAFSGDGEPTSAPEFPEAVELLARVMDALGIPGRLPVRLITNGSLMHRAAVQEGLARLAAIGGEAWFKLDRGSSAGMLEVNKTRMSVDQVLARLRQCAGIVPTWVQTCWFAWDGKAPGEEEEAAYLDLLQRAADVVQGVHLYGLARPSHQPEADRLGRLDEGGMEAWAERIRSRTGLKVQVSP